MTNVFVTEDLKAVQFAVSYEGHPIPARITAAALRKISSNDIEASPEKLIDAFLDHQEKIHAMALRHIEQGEPQVELTMGCFN